MLWLKQLHCSDLCHMYYYLHLKSALVHAEGGPAASNLSMLSNVYSGTPLKGHLEHDQVPTLIKLCISLQLRPTY